MTKAEEAIHDYSAYQQETEELGDNALARLQALAQEQVDAEAAVAAAEERLKEAQEAFNRVRLYKLPDLMDELGLTQFTTSSGIELKMDEEIRASISKENADAAFEYLEESKNGNLIKRKITIEFGKDEEAWAKKFMADCRRRKRPLNLKAEKGVHNSTLKAFVKDQLKSGEKIPQKVFGVMRQRFAKVKLPKE